MPPILFIRNKIVRAKIALCFWFSWRIQRQATGEKGAEKLFFQSVQTCQSLKNTPSTPSRLDPKKVVNLPLVK
jgi:hypothetical protein